MDAAELIRRAESVQSTLANLVAYQGFVAAADVAAAYFDMATIVRELKGEGAAPPAESCVVEWLGK